MAYKHKHRYLTYFVIRWVERDTYWQWRNEVARYWLGRTGRPWEEIAGPILKEWKTIPGIYKNKTEARVAARKMTSFAGHPRREVVVEPHEIRGARVCTEHSDCRAHPELGAAC